MRHKVQLDHPDRNWFYKYGTQPVLDVACGTALDGEAFEDYVGIDVTPSFIRSAKFDYGVESLILGDARFLPFREKCFSTSWCKDLLLHLSWEDAIKVLHELVRVGKKSFVAWGVEYIGDERREFTPLEDREVITKKSGYFYSRFSRRKLNKHFGVGPVIEGTTITEVWM